VVIVVIFGSGTPSVTYFGIVFIAEVNYKSLKHFSGLVGFLIDT